MQAAARPPDPTPLERAVTTLGGQAATGRLLEVSQGLVWQWLNGRPLPARFCPTIEQQTALRGKPVTCEELLPDYTWMRNSEGVVGYVVNVAQPGREPDEPEAHPHSRRCEAAPSVGDAAGSIEGSKVAGGAA